MYQNLEFYDMQSDILGKIKEKDLSENEKLINYLLPIQSFNELSKELGHIN